MASDPPGDPSNCSHRRTSHRNDHVDDVDLKLERPLICSNPSSYASSNSNRSTSHSSTRSRTTSSSMRSDASSLRTRNTARIMETAENNSFDGGGAAGNHDEEEEQDQHTNNRGYRRRDTSFTQEAAYFDEHYADPVESVAGGSYSMSMSSYQNSYSASLPRGGSDGGKRQQRQQPPPHHRDVTSSPPRREPDPGRDDRADDYGRTDAAGHGNGKRSVRGSIREELQRELRLVSYAEDPPDDRDRSTTDDDDNNNRQLVEWNCGANNNGDDPLMDGSGNTARLTDDRDSDFDDSDEDNCEEHYRRLPPPKVVSSAHDPGERHLVRFGDDRHHQQQQQQRRRRESPARERRPRREEPLRNNNNQLVPIIRSSNSGPRNNRNLEPEERRNVKTSTEVVAGIKSQLALVDPASEKYSGYQHCFITIEDEHRFLMLYTFLKRNVDAKVIIFFSTTKSTQYYAKLLRRLKFDARAIHNGQSEERFLEDFLDFSQYDGGGSILCVPDFQGRDLAIPPSCEWIIQFEPCSDPAEYIFRVGRISSENSRAVCRALLFLTPAQYGFLKYYKAAKVKFYEYEIPKISNVQRELIKLITKDYKLRKIGTEAYHAYLMAYAAHDFRDIYNVHSLDQHKVALCFGFDKPPSKDDAEKITFQDDLRGKEVERWRPVRREKKVWMKKEKKSWKYANAHADKMKSQDLGERDPDDLKPRFVKF